eukprot:9374189-Alexandrium_andersonii.AAC.1
MAEPFGSADNLLLCRAGLAPLFTGRNGQEGPFWARRGSGRFAPENRSIRRWLACIFPDGPKCYFQAFVVK